MIGGLAIEPRKSARSETTAWVIYTLGIQRFALPIVLVEKVLPAVEITPLPKAPQDVVGVINVQGRIAPVVDGRTRHGMPARELDVNDQLVLLRAGPRLVALLVDQVADVVECQTHEIVSGANIAPGMKVQGALKLKDGTIVLLEDGSQLLNWLDHDQLELPIEG